MTLDRRAALKGAAALVAAAHLPHPEVTGATPTAPGGRLYDLTIPEHALDALVKMRGDLSGAEVGWLWTGTIWAMVPGEGNRKLFDYDGFSAARFEAVDGGYRMLNRETGIYRDPASGGILASWLNPFLGREVPVLHRLNDHVNVEIKVGGRFGVESIPVTVMGDDAWWRLDMYFFRPSPISRQEFPLNVQHDMYQGSELTMYHARVSDIQNPAVSNIQAEVTFARVSQWEPFMEMGNRPGHMVFHAAGKKLMGGSQELAELNPQFYKYISEDHAEYLHAPSKWQPGTVSQWDAFKQLKESGE